MLTKERKILVVNKEMKEEKVKKLFNYEGLEIITNEAEIKSVWSRNKTPLMISRNLSERIVRNYPILDVGMDLLKLEPNLFIQFCHSNQIECGEYMTGEKFNTSNETCFLCEIANHRGMGSLSYYNQHVKEINDMIIAEYSNFFVKIEYGCLVRGMVMICPKFHVLSIANIPDSMMDEYLQIMKDMEFILKAIYGDAPVIFFEHGSASSGISSHRSSIVHAHTHVAWGVKFDKKYLDEVSLKPAKDIRDFKDIKYMSYQQGTDGVLMVVDDPNVYVQRQYPRQVIGDILGIEPEKTNWRNEPFMDNILRTFEDFCKFFVQNKNILQKRIFNATQGFVEGYQKRR